MIRLYSLHESSLAGPIVTTKPQEPHKVGTDRVCSSVHSSRHESDKPVDFSVIRLYSLRESSLAGPIVTTKLQELHKVGTEL